MRLACRGLWSRVVGVTWQCSESRLCAHPAQTPHTSTRQNRAGALHFFGQRAQTYSLNTFRMDSRNGRCFAIAERERSLSISSGSGQSRAGPGGFNGPGLYDTHIPTSTLQKLILAASSAFGGLHDPERADFIATLGDVTGHLALRRMRDKMRADPVGRALLRDRPAVTAAAVDLPRLRALPAGTFGRAYATFMDSRGFSPDERPSVHYVDDAELAYVMRRYRECHDFVHVLTGLGTSVAGEVAQKWYELFQTGLPVCLLSATVGPLRLPAADRLRLAAEWVPWAARCAADGPFMLCVHYERLFDRDLAALRRELGYAPPPYGIDNPHHNTAH